MSTWEVLAIIWWILLGAAIALICVILRGRRLWKGRDVDYAGWLDHECEVRFGKEPNRMVCVAVSHKGAIAVRGVDDSSGRHAVWISKADVPEMVRWV